MIRTSSFTIAVTAAALSLTAHAQTQRQFPGSGNYPTAPSYQLPELPVPPSITPNGKVVEDVIARVNDQIITRSEFERARQQLLEEARQQNISAAELDERENDLLRDMIDQDLLLSKGKQLAVSCDAETIRQLDEIRKQNHLDSMEALQKAAESQGVSFEDFKKKIKDQCITQSVVRDEVGRHIQMTQSNENEYYQAHMKDFEVPESVHLREILLPTPENATDAQIAEVQAKADALSAKLKGGADFTELAKTSSGGPTAAAGGDLGDFQRGKLGQVLEDATFTLPAGGNTAPIRTRQGFVILHVDSHQASGTPPMKVVEQQVQQALYVQQLQPALRAYLTKARQEAYVDIKPGFVDTGSNHKEARPTFAAYTPPAIKKKYQKKQRAEQTKASKDQEQLAAAREALAEKKRQQQEQKDAEVAAKASGTKAAKVKMPKKQKIRREKVRYGQAPRKSLPAGSSVATTVESTPLAGQAPGAALAPTESSTTITSGTGAVEQENPLDAQTGPEKKTRFAQHEEDAAEKTAEKKFAKAEVKATTRPVAATRTETQDESVQKQALGLNGDTAKKPKKAKRKKGDPKLRLEEKPKPDNSPAPVAPTVNPTLSTPTTTAKQPDSTGNPKL